MTLIFFSRLFISVKVCPQRMTSSGEPNPLIIWSTCSSANASRAKFPSLLLFASRLEAQHENGYSSAHHLLFLYHFWSTRLFILLPGGVEGSSYVFLCFSVVVLCLEQQRYTKAWTYYTSWPEPNYFSFYLHKRTHVFSLFPKLTI